MAIRVDLSPGEWAGLMGIVLARAEELRSCATIEIDEEVERDLNEQAIDLHRIAGIIREAIIRDGRYRTG